MRWIDMHCDTVSEIYKNRKGTLMKNTLCVDMERLERAGAQMQFFACFVNLKDYRTDLRYADEKKTKNPGIYIQNADGTGEDKESEDRAYKAVRRMISYAKEEIDRCNQADRKIKQQNTCFLNPVLTVEEGGVLGGKTERIDELYEEGVRLMTLTWNYENCIGSPNSANRKVMRKGLKPFGIETVRRMNELGMIVDVSHLSDGGFYDCVKYSEFPIVASHSNARSLCLHPRNLTDEMLRLLGNKGGVAGVNFYSAFLRKEGRAEISDIVKHILYMIDKAGEDAVAAYLEHNGYVIRDRNWRKNRLELDIVATKDNGLIIVEVKTRSNTEYIKPQDAVNWQKIRRIVIAADAYVKHFRIDVPVRFDIITAVGDAGAFEIEHIKEAFYPPVF